MALLRLLLRCSAPSAPRPPAAVEDAVWVDCFYYGFYMEKSKLPAFQASLRHQQAMMLQKQKQVPGS